MAEDHHETLEQKRLRQKQQKSKRILAKSHQRARHNKGPAARRDRRGTSQKEKKEEHDEKKKGLTVEERKKKKHNQQPINGRMIFVFFIGIVVGAFIRKDFFCWAMGYLFWAVGLLADIATILAAQLLGV